MLLGVAALLFLIYSAQKFRFVAALSYHKKAVRLFIGAALILLPAAGIWALWGYMNTIAILLHLAFFGRLPHWLSLYFKNGASSLKALLRRRCCRSCNLFVP